MHVSTSWGFFSCLWSWSLNWIVYIQTSDRDNAGTDSSVFIKLFGRNGETSSEIKLNNIFSNDFKSGNTDKFCIPRTYLKGFTQYTKLTNIELWKSSGGLFPDWKVDKIVVENRHGHTPFIFPVLRWIKPGRHYNFSLYDTSLPINANFPQQRATQLEETRRDYEFAQRYKYKGADAVGCKNIPDDEMFSRITIFKMFSLRAVDTQSEKLQVFLKGNTWKSIESMKEIFLQSDNALPEGLNNWNDDAHFGLQRLTGNNNEIIALYRNISDNFPVTNSLLGPLLEGMTILEAITQKRLFITDYRILHGVKPKQDFVQCAPIGLFLLDKNGNLNPIAIQLFQNPGLDNPIFTPLDPPNTWNFVKMWMNNADTLHHQAVTHLTGTHLTIEGIIVASHRNLAKPHPVLKLLAPHFLNLVPVNTIAIPKLIDLGEFVESVMNIGADGFMETVNRHLKVWRMDVHGDLPEFLKHRGLDDPNVLPGYYYRNDGLLVFQAIHDYVRDYVDIYYTDVDLIKGDSELQSWIQDIVRPADAPVPGCGIKGVPGNGDLTTTDQLVRILTSIIFTSSGQHAAGNFKQYEQYAFPPNCPLYLSGSPPKSKNGTVTEKDILDSLPNRSLTLKVKNLATRIEIKRTNPLGDFEVEYIVDPPAVKVVERFRSRLREVSATIKQRNTSRRPPYTILDPDNIPNSIAA